MNVNQKIENALSDLAAGNIWPLACPLEEKPNTFAVYMIERTTPADYGDDSHCEWIQHLEITWFSRSASGSKRKPVNYLAAEEKIIAALETAGFTVKNSIPGYEGDTGYTSAGWIPWMICCRHWRMLQMLTQYQKKCSQKERRSFKRTFVKR